MSSSCWSGTTITEPTAWLRGTTATVSARLAAQGITLAPGVTVITPIHPTRPGDPEDQKCDRCRAHIPEGRRLWCFAHHGAPGLIVTGGLCTACAVREWPDRIDTRREDHDVSPGRRPPKSL